MEAMLKVAVIVVVMLSPRIASACACLWPGLPGSAAERSYFLGQLKEADGVFSGFLASASSTSVTFNVDQVWRGAVPKPVVVFKDAPPRTDGSIPMDCSPRLDPETPYLVFVYKQTDGRVEFSRCAIWEGRDMENRVRWLRSQRKQR